MKYFMIVLRVLRVCVCVLSSSSMSSVVWRSGRSLASSVLGQLLKRDEIKMETVCQASVNKVSKTCTIQPF